MPDAMTSGNEQADRDAELDLLRAAASRFDERLADIQAEYRKSLESWERTRDWLTGERDEARLDCAGYREAIRALTDERDEAQRSLDDARAANLSYRTQVADFNRQFVARQQGAKRIVAALAILAEADELDLGDGAAGFDICDRAHAALTGEATDA